MFFSTQNTVFGEGYDANYFTDFKIYRYTKDIENTPSNEDGQIIVFASILNMDSYPISQIAITQSSFLFIRTKWYTGSWTSWKKIL